MAGSSPHARGTRCTDRYREHRGRLIPACAGNTRSDGAALQRTTAHPRMRGEHNEQKRAGDRATGSSPHARGTHEPGGSLYLMTRLIPACAGNTSACFRPASMRPAHPRMRGEHSSSRFTLVSSNGSSPHARGTPCFPDAKTNAHRLIPACAGNTATRRRRDRDKPAHPRMRGEHFRTTATRELPRDSSPHARGTPCQSGLPTSPIRLIPACAGNTCRAPKPASRPPAHPRMRGEHRGGRVLADRGAGSSPHARGTPPRRDHRWLLRRLIPACAGNT